MYLLKICFSDINECLDKQRTAMCPQHSDCLNTDGSYECNCKNGYQDTNGTCTGDKMSPEDKSTDLVSKIGLSVGMLVILVILIVAFVKWKKRTRQSTFGVKSNTNSDGHKNVENELTEIGQNLVVKT
ncbi:Hypothetical predicted protein [Mytilus galloprovincialis]|uniref:EGF-like domain-containing protein n=1 Tax=Mytilus galloprovincialis TaxID=29158 RepID=A0A8B6BWU1_MYTGA|nr:Hypothetical predicted protein [Mytilus galloprovincialis]